MDVDPYGLAARYRHRVYSQNQEDGITLALVELLDPPKFFIEIGAGDGLENNTRVLLERGWEGEWFDPMLVGHPPIDAVRIHPWKVYIPNAPQPRRKVGLLSIDVDGNDWHLWKACAPGAAIAIIECNIERGLDDHYVMPYDPKHVSTGGHIDYGATAASMIALGRELGMTFVCMEHINAFFVRDDLMAQVESTASR